MKGVKTIEKLKLFIENRYWNFKNPSYSTTTGNVSICLNFEIFVFFYLGKPSYSITNSRHPIFEHVFYMVIYAIIEFNYSNTGNIWCCLDPPHPPPCPEILASYNDSLPYLIMVTKRWQKSKAQIRN